MSKDYKVIFWDFDGVLMDSNSVRDLGFEEVLAQYPAEQVNQLMQFHRKNGGLSRYVKFRYFFEKVLQQKVSDEEIQKLANSFSEIMKAHLLNPKLLIKDSWQYLKKNYEQGIPMHIVSGSDQTELRYLCKKLEIDQYFKSIHGSPTPKIQLVSDLLKNYPFDKSDIVLIGDSFNDKEAADKNGISFWGYNNEELKTCSTYIETFSQ